MLMDRFIRIADSGYQCCKTGLATQECFNMPYAGGMSKLTGIGKWKRSRTPKARGKVHGAWARENWLGKERKGREGMREM
jgi:hypothetical protein